MVNGKKILAVIPARGGSKGVPKKNIKPLAGKPLIAWTIEAAKKSKYIDRLILSSDCKEIIATAKEFGCEVPFTRPAEMAGDNSPRSEYLLHALHELPGYDYLLMLQPTSPLRTVEDIDGFIEFTVESRSKAVVSVTETSKSPFWMYYVDTNHAMEPVVKQELKLLRQELPVTYVLNGALFIAEVDWFKKTREFMSEETTAYKMPAERSIDIDSVLDFVICEGIINSYILHTE